MTADPFHSGTIVLLDDTAIAAVNYARDAGLPDYQAKAEYLVAAGLAFDRAAERRTDQRPEFLG